MKKVLSTYNESPNKPVKSRLNKYLSDAGFCSRREADQLIAARRVRIDGRLALLGEKVASGQTVMVDDKEVKNSEPFIIIAFNKPRGIVCTTAKKEPNNIIDFIKFDHKIFPVGRLDKESAGLLLLTNDGELANKILKARNMHEKEYLVDVNKPITEEFIKKMSEGVHILDTVTRPCKVVKKGEYRFGIVLTQGLNRQIRRMCEYFGYKVKMLKRIRIMNISLGRLREGTWRNLTEQEIAGLRKMTGARKEKTYE